MIFNILTGGDLAMLMNSMPKRVRSNQFVRLSIINGVKLRELIYQIPT